MPDRPPLRDYSRSRAVVMGTWDYEFLDPVPAARNSMERMAGLLAGPLCGWPRERLLVLANERSPGDLADQVITAFEDVTDVALFYFVGHGQIAPDDQLCLGLALSRPDPRRRGSTSLRFSDVRQALLDSGAAVKIVILDCCFAGLAARGSLAGAAGEVLDLTAGTGAYTMAATSAYATAWYEHDPALTLPQTYFTRYLIDLIEEGIPGQPPRLRLDDLYRQLADNLGVDQLPAPRSRAVDDARDFEFAHNAAPIHTHRDPERELAQSARMLAEYQARVRALEAEAATRAAELARLTEQAAASSRPAAEQQPGRQDASAEAGRHRNGKLREDAPTIRGSMRGMTQPRLLGGRYELDGIAGRGGMAEVFRARDIRLDRIVGVKTLRDDLARDQAFQARFRREAQSMLSLDHPSIVAKYDTGEAMVGDTPVPYIVMEFVDGRTLRDLLRDDRRLLPERAAEITDGMLRALDYSHRNGIVHLDIKPGNVMVTRAADVKIMNFGVIPVDNADHVYGTPHYLSPERARGERADARSDLYSAGCLLYELLTGRPPFTGDSPVAIAYQHVREAPVPPSRIDPELPAWCDAIVLKAMEKDPADRYQSAGEMRKDIQRALSGAPVAASMHHTEMYNTGTRRMNSQATQPASPAPGAGMLRKLGRGRLALEPSPATEPEVKLVRQQRARSKQSGKR